MILETSARIVARISAGAQFTLNGNGRSAETVDVERTHVLVWERGATTAQLHSCCNGDAPVNISIVDIVNHGVKRTRGSSPREAGFHAGSLMGFLQQWIAQLPKAQR